MAGKSESLEAADADMFRGATWVVCPSVTASDTSIRNVLGIIAATNAEAFFVDPVEHDSYVAGISHLPFVVAATLVDTVTTDASWRDMSSLASSGFRDTTRLALGSPQMHRDILMTNREAVLRWVDQLQSNLSRMRDVLAGDEQQASEELLAFFTRAQDERAKAEVTASRSTEQKIGDGADPGTMGEQMSRMFLGGFGRRKKGDKEPRH
jgi:prephenate dehydrogenase